MSNKLESKRAQRLERTLSKALSGLSRGALGPVDPAFAAMIRRQTPGQALNGLSALANGNGLAAQALELAECALMAEPGRAEFHFSRGRALKSLNKLDAAAAAYEDALRLRTDYAEVWVSLGIVRRLQGRLQEAADSHRHALRLRPDFPEALTNLGNVLAERIGEQHGDALTAEELREAEKVHRRAVELAPQNPNAMHNLGIVLKKTGRYHEAAECFNQALGMDSRRPETVAEFGELLQRELRHDLARQLYENWLAHHPVSAAVEILLVECLVAQGEIEAALSRLDGVVAVDEVQEAIKETLGERIRQKNWGEGADGQSRIRGYRKAVEARPEFFEGVSSYLLALCYVEEDPAALFAEHQWRVAPLAALVQTRAAVLPPLRDTGGPASLSISSGAPARRVRVGYLSFDLKAHSVAYFLEGILEHHDRERFEVYSYQLNAITDQVTHRLERLSDHWRICGPLSDDEVAQRIREDGIDILVDLGGLTSGGRLGVLQRRPAPCQISYLGYPTSTGADCFSHRFSDAAIDPPGSEAYNAEPVLRLPQSMFCYRPGPLPDVAALPALRGEGVSFGSFNNLVKAGESTLNLWFGVLHAVPESRLVLKAAALSYHPHKEHLRRAFAAAGIALERLVLQPFDPSTQGHLATYGQVDIALDTFPYNGATTSCEALMMGVPVISLSGRTHPSRMGASVLRAAGLGHLVTDDPARYIELAADLASDLPRLAAIRSGLRDQLKASRLLDRPGFTRDFEAALLKAFEETRESIVTATAAPVFRQLNRPRP
jgi:predicted O-linked N-acetylglucosamine transferase (SPINDLY family)